MSVHTLVLANIRSTHNVGAILRTAEGFGVERVICTGLTPYPVLPDDARLPHEQQRQTRQIAKTALGAEGMLEIEQSPDAIEVIARLKSAGLTILGLEQTSVAVDITDYQTDRSCALVLGNEVLGLDQTILAALDVCLEIPMQGRKESFNVSVAAGIALFALNA